MKTKTCKVHGKFIHNGRACPKCLESSRKVMNKLNDFFSGLTVEFGKDGKPKVTRN